MTVGGCMPPCRPDHAMFGQWTLQTMRDLDIRSTDEDTPVNLVVGQAVRIHLPASPATGHAWELEGSVPPLLDMEADPGLAPFPSGAPRAGGDTQTWRLRAVGPGRIVLDFVSRRDWAATMAPTRRARFVIDIIAPAPASDGA
ncbi:protease inhibitor I42 family protein [Lysobacter aestuarii]|uniref:Protease inhibitor I42 family protein n=2 Tax=Marilutibacter aestuarii TaxID=1706195 RepID=A0A508ACC8_9GAMM|nr:protease inhibitor I42 family protein [Lysobacter aestuarii]